MSSGDDVETAPEVGDDGTVADGHDDDGADQHDLAPAPRRGRVALLISGVMTLVVGGLVVVLAGSPTSTDREAYSSLLDEPVPAVAGESLDGEAFDIDDHLGRWVVVNFFALWCPPCIEEHPELVALDEAHRDLGDVKLVSVVFDDNPDAVADFFETRGGDWPVLPDVNGQIATEFGVAQVPETYLVDPSGVVRAKLIGGVTQDGLERYLDAVGGVT